MTTNATVTPAAPATRRRAVRLRVGTAAVALAGLTLLGACGTSTTTGTTTGAASTTTANTASAAATDTAFDQCMTRNGVTKPTGGPGGSGSAGGSGSGSGAASGGTPPQGGTPPSGAPKAGGTGAAPSGQAPPGVDSATWQKALAACKSEAGAPPSASSGS
jgi:hypothetical protein